METITTTTMICKLMMLPEDLQNILADKEQQILILLEQERAVSMEQEVRSIMEQQYAVMKARSISSMPTTTGDRACRPVLLCTHIWQSKFLLKELQQNWKT